MLAVLTAGALRTATAGPADAIDAADAARLADELVVALRAAGASDVERLDRAGEGLREVALRARDGHHSLLICADNLVAHPSLLWTLATEPAGRSTALVVADPHGDLRDDRGKVVPA